MQLMAINEKHLAAGEFQEIQITKSRLYSGSREDFSIYVNARGIIFFICFSFYRKKK